MRRAWAPAVGVAAALCAASGACTLSTEGTGAGAGAGASTGAGPGAGGGSGGGAPCVASDPWARPLAPTSGYPYMKIAAAPGGGAAVAGGLAGTGDLGTGQLTVNGSQGVLVAALDAAGDALWAKQFSAPMPNDMIHDYANDVSVGADGAVLITGVFRWEIDFGGGALPANMTNAAFAAKLDKNGDHLWSLGVPNARGYGARLTADGGAYVAGRTEGAVQIGADNHPYAGGDDGFVARIDPSGLAVWSKVFGDAFEQRVRGIAVDADGDVLITGGFEGSFTLGEQLTSLDRLDAFLIKIGADGTPYWSRALGGPDDQFGRAVAVAPDGSVILAGSIRGTIDTGGQQVGSGGQDDDLFVAKYDTSGNRLWLRTFGDDQRQNVRGVATDASGRIYLTGEMEGTLAFGPDKTLDAGSVDNVSVFLAVLDAGGLHVFSEVYGSSAQDQTGDGVSVDPCGAIFLSGTYAGELSLLGAPLEVPPGDTGFAAKLAPLPAL